MPVGTNQFECIEPKRYYVCSTGFRGCCSHDPCAAESCEDDKTTTFEAQATTSTTTSSKVQSQTSAPTITTSTVTATSSTSSTAATASTTPTAVSDTGPVSDDPSDSDPSINIALIGGIVGGILALILAAFFIFFFCRRKKKIRRCSTLGYDSFQEKTTELDSPNDSYQFTGYKGTAANYNTSSILKSEKSSAIAQDPVLLASTPLLPNELPASPPSHALELPCSVYKPPLPEVSQNPTPELTNQRNSQQNSHIQSRRTTLDTSPSLLTTTPEGTVLRSNLNTSVRGKGSQKRPDPRHHVMSFMSYDNISDTRIEGQRNPSSTSLDQVSVPKPVASATLGSTN